MILRCVPFVNWDEWISVKNGLFSQSLHEKDEAIRRVEVWRIRGNIPHSVDLTAQLIDIRQQDPQFNETLSSQSPSISHSALMEHLRLLYSIVIIRAVNGIVEPNQTTYFAQSILTIAERLGLPGWIVELRHDATHKQLPSLSVLRAASDYLLTWYHQNYWQPQEGLLQSLTASCIPIKFLHQSNNGTDTSENQNTKANNELWYKTFQKNAVSCSFLMEIFLPFFTSIITKLSWEEELKQFEGKESIEINDIEKYQQILQKFIKHQLSIWKAPLHCLLPFKDNWLHACLCRLLYVATQEVESQRSLTSFGLEFIYKIKLILFWCKYLIELYYLPVSEYVQRSSEKKKKKNKTDIITSFPEVLVQQRKKFIQTMKGELEIKAKNSFEDHSDIHLLLELVDAFCSSNNMNDERLSSLLQKVTSSTFLSTEENSEIDSSNQEKDEIMIEDVNNGDYEEENDDEKKEGDSNQDLREAPPVSSLGKRSNQNEQTDQGQKRLKSSDSSSSASINSLPTISYIDYVSHSSLPGIRRCSDFPVWPLGLRPGRYDCDDLSQLEEIPVDEED